MEDSTSGILINLDRERHIRLNSNSLCDVEQVFDNTPMGTLLLPSRLGLQVIRALLWAGLRHEEPRLTLAKTGELIDQHLEKGGALDDIALKVNEALKQAGFKEEDGKPTRPGEAKGQEPEPGPFASAPG